jgi:hypothetical protein
VRYEVLTAMNANVSEEPAAPIFRMKRKAAGSFDAMTPMY